MIGAVNPDIRIDGDLVVWDTRNLVNFQTFPEMTALGRSLRLERNEGLTSLAGLEALTTLGGRINISRNPELSHLMLDSLVSVGGDSVYIGENPRLPECEVTELYGRLSEHGFSGLYYNTGNDVSGACD